MADMIGTCIFHWWRQNMLSKAVFGKALKRGLNQSLPIPWLCIRTINHDELS